jgi:hypothetical protein
MAFIFVDPDLVDDVNFILANGGMLCRPARNSFRASEHHLSYYDEGLLRARLRLESTFRDRGRPKTNRKPAEETVPISFPDSVTVVANNNTGITITRVGGGAGLGAHGGKGVTGSGEIDVSPVGVWHGVKKVSSGAWKDVKSISCHTWNKLKSFWYW